MSPERELTADNTEKERLPSSGLPRLRWLLKEWSDEDPGDMVSTGQFKVRKTFYMNLVGELDEVIRQGLISDPDMAEEVRLFSERYTSQEFKKQSRVTGADIQAANSILGKVVGHVEGEILRRAGERIDALVEELLETEGLAARSITVISNYLDSVQEGEMTTSELAEKAKSLTESSGLDKATQKRFLKEVGKILDYVGKQLGEEGGKSSRRETGKSGKGGKHGEGKEGQDRESGRKRERGKRSRGKRTDEKSNAEEGKKFDLDALDVEPLRQLGYSDEEIAQLLLGVVIRGTDAEGNLQISGGTTGDVAAKYERRDFGRMMELSTALAKVFEPYMTAEETFPPLPGEEEEEKTEEVEGGENYRQLRRVVKESEENEFRGGMLPIKDRQGKVVSKKMGYMGYRVRQAGERTFVAELYQEGRPWEPLANWTFEVDKEDNIAPTGMGVASTETGRQMRKESELPFFEALLTAVVGQLTDGTEMLGIITRERTVERAKAGEFTAATRVWDKAGARVGGMTIIQGGKEEAVIILAVVGAENEVINVIRRIEDDEGNLIREERFRARWGTDENLGPIENGEGDNKNEDDGPEEPDDPRRPGSPTPPATPPAPSGSHGGGTSGLPEGEEAEVRNEPTEAVATADVPWPVERPEDLPDGWLEEVFRELERRRVETWPEYERALREISEEWTGNGVMTTRLVEEEVQKNPEEILEALKKYGNVRRIAPFLGFVGKVKEELQQDEQARGESEGQTGQDGYQDEGENDRSLGAVGGELIRAARQAGGLRVAAALMLGVADTARKIVVGTGKGGAVVYGIMSDVYGGGLGGTISDALVQAGEEIGKRADERRQGRRVNEKAGRMVGNQVNSPAVVDTVGRKRFKEMWQSMSKGKTPEQKRALAEQLVAWVNGRYADYREEKIESEARSRVAMNLARGATRQSVVDGMGGAAYKRLVGTAIRDTRTAEQLEQAAGEIGEEVDRAYQRTRREKKEGRVLIGTQDRLLRKVKTQRVTDAVGGRAEEVVRQAINEGWSVADLLALEAEIDGIGRTSGPTGGGNGRSRDRKPQRQTASERPSQKREQPMPPEVAPEAGETGSPLGLLGFLGVIGGMVGAGGARVTAAGRSRKREKKEKREIPMERPRPPEETESDYNPGTGWDIPDTETQGSNTNGGNRSSGGGGKGATVEDINAPKEDGFEISPPAKITNEERAEAYRKASDAAEAASQGDREGWQTLGRMSARGNDAEREVANEQLAALGEAGPSKPTTTKVNGETVEKDSAARESARNYFSKFG